jgi:hypothetical protein
MEQAARCVCAPSVTIARRDRKMLVQNAARRGFFY